MSESEVIEHDHGRGPHIHAWANYTHSHLLRAICTLPECEGCPTHNIHSGPRLIDGSTHG